MPNGEMRIATPDLGDLKIIWDSEKPDEVEYARKAFDEYRKKGYTAYNVDKKGEKTTIMNKFDPDAEKMVLLPFVAGG